MDFFKEPEAEAWNLIGPSSMELLPSMESHFYTAVSKAFFDELSSGTGILTQSLKPSHFHSLGVLNGAGKADAIPLFIDMFFAAVCCHVHSNTSMQTATTADTMHNANNFSTEGQNALSAPQWNMPGQLVIVHEA